MLKRFLIVFVALAALSGPWKAAGAAETTLHFRLGEDPETLYSIKTLSLTANTVIGPYLLERLVYFDASGQPQPWLAESWAVSEDQKTLTFKLRGGVTFTDGTVLDAAAVKAQFDSVLDKKNASLLVSRLGALLGVEAPDATTVRFVFDKPFAPFFANIAQASFGINSPTAVTKFGDQYGRNPVGSGPYMLKSWVPGSEITLVRNPHYKQFRGDARNKGLPIAGTIVLTVISEEAVAQAALESGELTAGAVAADAIDNLVKNPGLTTVINKSVTNLLFLEFNEMHAPFDNVDMRRAIGYAVDRAAIVKAAYNNYASPALGPLANGIPGYDAKMGETYGTPFDPAKAKALLAKTGWVRGADGKLSRDGKPALFLLKSYSGFEPIDRTLAVIQSNLNDIGIAVKIETSDFGTLYPSLLKPDWDMDLMRWTSSDPSVLNNVFRSPGHRKNTLPSAEQDALLDRCNLMMDFTARMACVGEAQKLLLESATVVPVLSDWLITITQKNVKDYHLDYFNNIIPGDISVVD